MLLMKSVMLVLNLACYKFVFYVGGNLCTAASDVVVEEITEDLGYGSCSGIEPDSSSPAWGGL